MTSIEPVNISGQGVFIAESQEPIFSYGDPSGLSSTKTELVFHVTVVGVFSNYVNAEAALDKRLGRKSGQRILTQFRPDAINGDGPCSWVRDIHWDDYRGELGDQTCWQLIKRVKVDG